MREIIFRGKRDDNGEWVYGNLYTDKYKTEILKLSVWENFNNREVVCNFPIDKATVGQYTGLQDKNGNRIFEGDILKIYYYGKSKIFGVVKFDESRFFIDDDFMRDDIKAKAPMTEMFSRYKFEVIGNIHDNSELIK